MNLRRLSKSFCGCLLGIALLGGFGCQSSLKVTVHRVVVPTAAKLQVESPMGQKVVTAIMSLEEFVKYSKEAYDAVKRFVDENEEYREALAAYAERVANINKTAQTLLSECRALFEKPDIATEKTQISLVLEKTRRFFDQSAKELADLQAESEKFPAISSISVGEFSQLGDFNEQWLMAAKEGKTELKAGYMGLTATDVYEINPSDENYRFIFGAGGSGGRQVHTKPLTEAKISATGDSSLMIVMENAGQVRVYQVSNDPAQITRNIGLLVSKATAAIAKFGAVGAP